jgi:hypothetical protein
MGKYYLNSLSFRHSILDRINRFDTSIHICDFRRGDPEHYTPFEGKINTYIP